MRDYFGSYYYMEMPDGGADGVRVEAPHLRFVARGHYDQAHFSKDFKDRTGYSPSEFIKARMMMRFDIEKRLEILHKTRFSLIA